MDDAATVRANESAARAPGEVRVPYEVRVGAALGPMLCSAVPHVRSAATAAHVTLVVEAGNLDAVIDTLRALLVPGVTLELLRVATDDGVPGGDGGERPATLTWG
jgi:hypothetical protein